ncbi:MAG: ATP-binding protein [Vicinamibacterales bacterium]
MSAQRRSRPRRRNASPTDAPTVVARVADASGHAAGRASEERSADLLARLVELQVDFAEDLDATRVLPRVLDDLLELTESGFCLVGEARVASSGAAYFELLDAHNVHWSDSSPTRLAGRAYRPTATDLGPLIDRVLADGRALVVDATTTDATVDAELKARHAVVLPVRLGEKIVGVVAFGDRRTDDDHDVAMLVTPYVSMVGGLLRAASHQAQFRRLQDELKSREDLYRDLFDSASDLIHSVRPDGGFAYVNRAWRDTLGYTDEEVASLRVQDVVEADAHGFYATVFALAVPGTPPEPREMVLVAKDGRRIAVEGAEGCRFVDGVPVVTRAIYRDVTRRKSEEEALRRAKAAAEEAARAKGYFLANMTHELRTPMNAVIGMTEFLFDTPLTTEQAELVGTIQRAGENLLDIINNILDFSKIESGKLDLDEQPFDVREVVEHAVDLVAGTAASKGIDLAYMLAPGVTERVSGDETRLRQVLVNLLSNAVKFTPAGEVVVTVEGHALDGAYELYVRVRDTGIGIPTDRVDRLFQSFSQVDTSTNRQFGGTGLGLAICRRLVELMGGAIWVESRLGQGSTFHFTILVQAAAGASAPELSRPQPALAGKRILIAAESSTLRRLLLDQCHGWGMVATAAATHEQALAEARHVRADLVVVDTQATPTDAVVLASELRALAGHESTPLVFLCHRGQAVDDIEGLPNLRWLTKPVKQRRLLATCVEALTGEARQPRPDASDIQPGARRDDLRILLAEDNAINQQVATRMLDRLGYRADVVGNGRDALDALARRTYDVLLLDVQMPIVDGFEVARRVRERSIEPRPRIIGMTALALPADRERCLNAGMDDYVSKPIRLDALRSAIARGLSDDRTDPAVSMTSPSTPAMRLVEAPEPRSTARVDTEPPVLDMAAIDALRLLDDGTGPDFVAELLARWQDELPGRLDALADAVAAGRANKLERLAHTLKSSCATIGAMRMADLCQRIETSAAAADLGSMGTLVPRLQEVAVVTRAALGANRRALQRPA